MRLFTFLTLLVFLSGCLPDKKTPAYSTAICQTKKWIDQQDISFKYVIVYEGKSDQSGSIYIVLPSGTPYTIWDLERPVEVIEYKGKYICFISYMEQTGMSYRALQDKVDFKHDKDTLFHGYNRLLGVSADGKHSTWITEEQVEESDFDPFPFCYYPPLWQYLSDTYDEQHPPRFILSRYRLCVDDGIEAEKSLKEHLVGIKGVLYCPDSILAKNVLTDRPSCWGVIHNSDTLMLTVTGGIEQEIWFESLPNSDFFSALPQKNTWYALYDLLRDSTFYFEYHQQKCTTYSVMYGHYLWEFDASDDKNQSFRLYKQGTNTYVQTNMGFEMFKDDL